MNGIEKNVDELGRVVLPVKMRKKLNLKNRSAVLITMEDDTILITPKERHCALCGNNNIIEGVRLCQACVSKVKAL